MANIILRRLVILKAGKSVYDEPFHTGVNIIRGENGVGKSTILNAIYYLLGGDFSKWLPEIEQCDFVLGEVEFNSKTFSIRREITRVGMQPMYVFFGSYSAASSESHSWVPFTYRRLSKGDSFSQLLFKALDFPEVETQDDEYITFNQALRLMYIDQTSPLDELMKDIDFDSPLIRKTVGDLLLGVYDNTLFNQQLLVKELRKNHTSFEGELKLLKSIYSANEDTIDINEINNKIKGVEKRLSAIDLTLEGDTITITKVTERKERILRTYQEDISKESQKLKDAVEHLKIIELDTVDTEDFISELQRQISALDESAKIRNVLGTLEVHFCPSCLTPVRETDNNKCQLCKEPIEEEASNARIFRIRQQLKSQVNESQILLGHNRLRAEELNLQISALQKSIRFKQTELNKYVQNKDSDQNYKYAELLVEKGRLLQQIEMLTTDLNTANKYWSIYNAYQRNKSEIERLTELIAQKVQRQEKKYKAAIESINKYSKSLLKQDGDYESQFSNASYVTLDFYKNTYALDGRNNFSASSLVILKNSVRFGIFFASLVLDFMRYPRFIICDNIEDKGMNERRSKNFQKNLVSLANSDEFKDKPFQIIYSTSMIEETLNTGTYTIGEYYTPSSKSLKLEL